MNLSHLFNTETVEIKRGDEIVFTVTVREITYGDKVESQRRAFENFSADVSGGKSNQRKAISEGMANMMRSGDMLKVRIYEELAAIESWTLTDADGNSVPVSMEAWQALPKWVAVQIEEVIERLNPEPDEDTKS